MEQLIELIEHLIQPLLLGCLAYAFTYWAYKQELKAAQRFSRGLQYYRDLLIQEGENEKSKEDHGD